MKDISWQYFLPGKKTTSAIKKRGGAKMHTLAHVTARDQLQAHAVYTLNIKMTRFNFSTSVTS